MIKSFHHNLKGKIKIIWKPRPIGNKIKNLSDAATNIVLSMELYEVKDIMEWPIRSMSSHSEQQQQQ